MGLKKIIIEVSPRDDQITNITDLMQKCHEKLRDEVSGWWHISSKVIEVIGSETISH